MLFPVETGSVAGPYSVQEGNQWVSVVWAGLFVLAHVGKTWWRRQRGRDADPCSQSQHAGSVAALSSLPKGHVWLQQQYK